MSYEQHLLIYSLSSENRQLIFLIQRSNKITVFNSLIELSVTEKVLN